MESECSINEQSKSLLKPSDSQKRCFMNLTMMFSMLIFRSTVIGVVSGGPGDGTRLGKSCAGGRTLFARIGYQELEWIKKFTKEMALDSKCNKI